MGGLLGIFIVPVRTLVGLIAIASASLTIAVEAQRGEIPFDPFAPYADFLPGQPSDKVSRWGFGCQYNVVPPFREFCSLNPEMGIFSDIVVLFASDVAQVSRVVFTPREKMLTLGDLVVLWGKPEVATYSNVTNFRWRDRNITAIPERYDGHFSYWLPIKYVAFEGSD